MVKTPTQPTDSTHATQAHAGNPLRLAFTPGEPAGIGQDLAVLLSTQPRDYELVTIASRSVLESRAKQLGVTLNLRDFNPSVQPQPDAAGDLCVLDIPTDTAVTLSLIHI